jgi:hypothetical protein
MGWSSKRNGELLQPMLAAKFAALLTVDQNIEFQQNVRASGVGVVVLVANTNRIKELGPLVPQILAVLDRLVPGELVRIGG